MGEYGPGKSTAGTKVLRKLVKYHGGQCIQNGNGWKGIRNEIKDAAQCFSC
jgi:ABC-type oligopeptide transport system ATPase subunit